MGGGGPPGKSGAGQIHSTPEELDRTGLSDERRAKICHAPVGLNQLLPECARRVGIVFNVLIVTDGDVLADNVNGEFV
jgi:hypothetical protein